jgi:hypothetical protein
MIAVFSRALYFCFFDLYSDFYLEYVFVFNMSPILSIET